MACRPEPWDVAVLFWSAYVLALFGCLLLAVWC